jgi:ribonuclease HI
VFHMGGAAAVQLEEEEVRTVRVLAPRSSTHCELVALFLALDFPTTQILTDSRAALLMLQKWGSWPLQRTLHSADRMDVRRLIDRAMRLGRRPQLVKVKAHDVDALRLGHPRARGNDLADTWAKRAATEAGHPDWVDSPGPFGDPVELRDATGAIVLDVRTTLASSWWERRHRSTARARPFLERLYPKESPVNWAVSTGIFRRPTVSGSAFVHPVYPAMIKWMARVRAGCLPTRARLVGHGMVTGSRQCLCCGADEEDDEHILAGCPATGTADWRLVVDEAWRGAAQAAALPAGLPPDRVLQEVHIMLLGALIPQSAVTGWGLPAGQALQFLAALHRGLAEAVAERLRRRGELLAATGDPGQEESQLPGQLGVERPDQLPRERRLSVADLRNVETRRQHNLPAVATPLSEALVACPVPAAGEPRRRWLRQRLVVLVQEDMVECPHSEGVAAVGVLEIFERLTGEAFSDTPGALVGSRVRGIAKVLGNVSREEGLDPPLLQTSRRGTVFWNRRPQVPVDVAAWRRSVEAAEAHSAPVPRLREQMAAADAGLAAWVTGHQYLPPAPVETGESGMALLLLWEVDHRRPYPSLGGDRLSVALLGFSKRLQDRVAQEPVLSQWLVWKDMATPLCPGLAPSHHRRWSVRVAAPGPGEPQGWYVDFVSRWKAYLETLAGPRGSRPSASVDYDQAVARIRLPAFGRGCWRAPMGRSL